MTKPENEKTYRTAFIIGVLFLFGLWISTYFVVTYLFGSPDGPGQFGDIFGSINALFAGLAIAGAVYAIFLQSRELALQRQELQLQREELKEIRGEHAKHNELVETQVKTLIDQSERQKRREEFLAEPRIHLWKPTIFDNKLDYNRNGEPHMGILYFENLGGPIFIPKNQNPYAIRCAVDFSVLEFRPSQLFSKNHRGTLRIETKNKEAIPDSFMIEIDFEDSLARKGTIQLYFKEDKTFTHDSVRYEGRPSN